MTAANKHCLIDDMLAELSRGRKSMETQECLMAEILEKSNNVLLQLEATRSKVPPTNAETPTTKTYTYNKENIHTLSKLLEQFHHLLDEPANEKNAEASPDFAEYLQTNRQRLDYLSSNMRKLLAANDTVSQMKMHLLEPDEEKLDSDEELSSG